MTATKGGGKKERERGDNGGEEKQRETEAGNDIDPITLTRAARPVINRPTLRSFLL